MLLCFSLKKFVVVLDLRVEFTCLLLCLAIFAVYIMLISFFFYNIVVFEPLFLLMSLAIRRLLWTILVSKPEDLCPRLLLT